MVSNISPGGISVDGLISGLDTQNIIEQLVAISSQRIGKLETEQAVETDKITLFQQIQALALGVRTASDTLSNPDLFEEKSADVSNPLILSASADSTSVEATHEVTVVSLAAKSQVVSNRFTSEDTTSGVSGDISITVGEGAEAITTTISITGTNNTFKEIKEAINNSGAKVTASIVQVDDSSAPYRLIVNAQEGGSAGAFTATFSNSSFETTVTNEEAGPGKGIDTAAASDSDVKTFAFKTNRPNPGLTPTVKIGATSGTAETITEKLDVPTISGIKNVASNGDLVEGTDFYYKVTAVDASGETTGSEIVSINTGTGGDDQKNTLTIDRVANAESYNIYWSSTPDFTGSFIAGSVADPGSGTTVTFSHKKMGNSTGSNIIPGAPPAASLQGYTVDFDTGAVNFNDNLDTFIFKSGTNNIINFDFDHTAGVNPADINLIGSGELLESGVAVSGTEVAAAIKEALETADATAATYTVTFDSATKKFNIKKDSGANFTINWASSTAAATLGFTNSDVDVASGGAGVTGDTETNKVFLTYKYGGLEFKESQKSQDAVLKLGTGESSFTITKSSNQITDLFKGVTLNLIKADSDTTVAIEIKKNNDGVNGAVSSFVDSINTLLGNIQEQTFFDPETLTSGPLLSDPNVLNIRNRVNSILTGPVNSIESGKLRSLSEVGISINPDTGSYKLDSAKFSTLLTSKAEEVRNLFSSIALSSDVDVQARSLSEKAVTTSSVGHLVDITKAAKRAEITGAQDISSSGLTADETITLVFGTTNVNAILSTGMTAQTAVSTINSALLAANVKNARAVYDTTTGKITVRTDEYGIDQKFTIASTQANTRAGSTGLGSATANAVLSLIGQDVAGTIGGESATGDGQVLTGDSGNIRTDGLSLVVTISETDLAAQGSLQGSTVVNRGIGTLLTDYFKFLTDETKDGPIQTAISQANARVDDVKASIELAYERANNEKNRLLEEFSKLEQALGSLQTTGSYLSSQLKQIEANSNAFASRGSRK